ncbi:stage II sporulation protein M [Fervidibacillus albus]|uniref:stage II sporulation protein M n=1 Tax=Fervidibacillus albus TaxID=2980026 RepID=UPI003B848ADD
MSMLYKILSFKNLIVMFLIFFLGFCFSAVLDIKNSTIQQNTLSTSGFYDIFSNNFRLSILMIVSGFLSLGFLSSIIVFINGFYFGAFFSANIKYLNY